MAGIETPQKPRWIAEMHPVRSTNLKAIGFQKAFGPQKEDVLRISFQRGHVYDYYPVNEKTFNEGLIAERATDWFNNEIKSNKNLKFEKVI